MGYNTIFEGALTITCKLNASELEYLKSILKEDVREHPEWNGKYKDTFYWINLELSKDCKSLLWSGSEKTYGMVDAILLVIKLMQERNPNFGLYGYMCAQGEEFDDRWYFTVDGSAISVSYDFSKFDKSKWITLPPDSSQYEYCVIT